jgi:hypothetical protein
VLKNENQPGKFQAMSPVSFDRIEAILFDFEGTLVDSQWNRTGAVQEEFLNLLKMGFS